MSAKSGAWAGEFSGPQPMLVDRVTLEIRAAKLKVAIEGALRQPDAAVESEAKGFAGSIGEDAGDSNQAANHALEVEISALRESLEEVRASLRDREQDLEEAFRQKEILQVAKQRLDQKLADVNKVADKAASLEGQVIKLTAQLQQATSSRTNLMSVINTLKSTQDEIRHAQSKVSQRCVLLENALADLENVARRGDALIQTQKMELHEQACTLERQKKELTSVGEERAELMVQADRTAAELDQARARDTANKAHCSQLEKEISDLQDELQQASGCFSKYRAVMDQQQEVIEAHEKATGEARSEYLALSLEVEKMSNECQKKLQDANDLKDEALEEKRTLEEHAERLKAQVEQLQEQLAEATSYADHLKAQLATAAQPPPLRPPQLQQRPPSPPQQPMDTGPGAEESVKSSPTPRQEAPAIAEYPTAQRPTTPTWTGGGSYLQTMATPQRPKTPSLWGQPRGLGADSDSNQQSDTPHNSENKRLKSNLGEGKRVSSKDSNTPNGPQEARGTGNVRTPVPSWHPKQCRKRIVGTYLDDHMHMQGGAVTGTLPRKSIGQVQPATSTTPVNKECPDCKEEAYGLMLICGQCRRQRHSSCVSAKDRIQVQGHFVCSECKAASASNPDQLAPEITS